ncbi:hypothetical protein QTP88_006370 [Uroleucon formosanum]
MIDTVKQEIGNINFECTKKESETFSKKMNDQLSDMNLPDDLVVKYELSIVRNIRKKRMYDEICEDEIPQLPIVKFRINTFRVILDQIKESLNRRFSVNKKYIADVQFMVPKNFHCILNMPKDSLKELADIANIDLDKLKLELQNFSKVYPKISKSVEKRTKLIYSISETEEKSNMEIELKNKEVDGIYDNMFPFNFERTFSKLKLIKTKLRSNLNQENLESLLLMLVEKELLDEIDVSEVVYYLKESSTIMYQMLNL